MKTFFLKHLLHIQSAIRLMIIDSTGVEIFVKDKIATFEFIFSKILSAEVEKRAINEEITERIYMLSSCRQFHGINTKHFVQENYMNLLENTS